MILACPTNYSVPACDRGVQIKPIEQVKKRRPDFYNNRDSAGGPVLIAPRVRFARRKCQIATLRKSGVEFYTSIFCEVRALIINQNPFSQRENLPNTGETQLVPAGKMDEKIAASVTTRHLLLAIQRGEATTLLPFSQPISHLAEWAFTERAQGGGGSRLRIGRKRFDGKAHTEILFLLVPLPVLLAPQKTRFELGSNPEPSANALSRESTTHYR
jgi:hypothetical protein